jgi:hypothetical protein
VQADGLFGTITGLEIIPLEHAGHGIGPGQLNDVTKRHGPQPFGVIVYARARRVEDPGRLLEVGPAVRTRFLKGQRWTRFGAATRIPNGGGEIPHHEDGLMPKVLELPELAQHYGMAQV